MSRLVEIDTLSDSRLAPYRDVVYSRDTRETGLFIVEGEKLARRLIASDLDVVSILMARSFVERILPRLETSAPVYVVDDHAVRQLTGFNFHRGVMACGRRPASADWRTIAFPLEAPLLVAVCPATGDAENLGGIIRSLWAFDADGLLVSDKSIDPFSRRVVRVSMGSVFRLPIIESSQLLQDVRNLACEGPVEIIATVCNEDAEALPVAQRARRAALLFGSEGFGLPEEWARASDRRVSIPMSTGADSLNVSVAAGIFLYHFTQAKSIKSQTGPVISHE